MRRIALVSLYLATAGYCATCLSSAVAADQLNIELSSSHQEIRIVVLNTSNQSIRVNTRLAHGPSFGLWDLYFEVRDVRGQRREYSMKATIDPPRSSDWRDLQPDHFIGMQIPFDWLGLEYDLDRGEYDVTANYRITSSNGHVLHNYRSNTLHITIDRDRDQQEAALKERGELYEVDLDAARKKAESKPKSSQ